MDYLMHILILIGIYIVLSVSLNLVAGYTGLLSVAHAGFWGVGAYVAALMALRLQTPFLANVICAAALSALAGALVGLPSLKLREDCFIISAFAFQVIVFSVFNNWVSLTGGPVGLAGVPQPTVLGVEISSRPRFLILVSALCALTLWVVRRIVQSAAGRLLKAIREDEVFAQASGKSVAASKLLVLVVGAGLAGVAGAMYAHYFTFIDPSSFTVMESIFIIAIVIIGGAGSFWGPVFGAVVLVTLPELLRFLGLPSAVAANIRQILYGGLLVVFMMWRPQGLLGEYAFQKGGSER